MLGLTGETGERRVIVMISSVDAVRTGLQRYASSPTPGCYYCFLERTAFICGAAMECSRKQPTDKNRCE